MLIKSPMKKGAPTARTTKCISTEQSSTPALDASYPHSEWLSTLPFDTQEFTLFASDQPLGDEVAIKLPPLPFVKATKNKSRFELQNDRGSRMRTSMQRPITQQFLNNKRLDPLIIAEQRPIYLGVGPADRRRSLPRAYLPRPPLRSSLRQLSLMSTRKRSLVTLTHPPRAYPLRPRPPRATPRAPLKMSRRRRVTQTTTKTTKTRTTAHATEQLLWSTSTILFAATSSSAREAN